MFSKYKVNSVSHDNIIGSNETVDSSEKDEVRKQRELDAQRALNETGFGKFNYKIILVTGLICMNVAFSITTIGFILPSAACDFHMTTIDKGRLSAAPILGMVFGACLWGCIADTKGRRTTLLYCLFLQALFDGLASIISNYWGFIVFKFISGLAMSGQLAILYTYVGEFQPENYRGKAMSFMEMSWVLGMMLVPVLAWITLSLDIDFSNSIISFKSWNLFTAMSSLPALIVGLLLLRLPETPKYLAERSRYTELRNVLHAMYRQNTGKPTEEYIAKMNNAGITFLTDRSIGLSIEKDPKRVSVLEAFRNFLPTLYTQTMILLKPPYIGRTLITCIGSYCIFGAIYTLMLWFPELFHRFADFEAQHPNETASVCIVSQMSQKLGANNDSVKNLTLSIDNQTNIGDLPTDEHCDSTIETQVYIHTLILAVSCVPVALIFMICADRFGFRFYLVFNNFGCCALVLSMIFVTNSTQNLVISCIYEALVSLSVTVIYCISVEIFPTHLRVTGSALASVFGRFGSLVGNLLFGFLMDDHCLVLISIVAVELFVAGILSFFLKNSDDETEEKASTNVPEIDIKHSDSEKYTGKNVW